MERTKLVTVLSAACAFVLLSADASAQTAEFVTEDGLAKDAQVYANNMGISIDEAIHRFKLQDLAGELETDLSANYPETFAGLWLEHKPKFHIVASFTRHGQASAAPYIASNSALEGMVEVRSAAKSLATLQKEQIQAMTAIRRAGIPADLEINVRENRVELKVAERNNFDMAVSRGDVRLPPGVKVITVPGLVVPESHGVIIQGGVSLDRCTAGFSVKNPSGVTGLTTAAHCNNAQFIPGWFTVGDTALRFRKELLRDRYDVQWHTAPNHTAIPKFVADWNIVRDVTAIKGRGSQVVGGYVCKYGATSGYTCGHISSKWVAPSPSHVPSPDATFIMVTADAGYADLSEPGDSGGPWFNSTTAYGVHVGGQHTVMPCTWLLTMFLA